MVNIARRDVRLPRGVSSVAIVSLANLKSRRFLGRHQFIVCRKRSAVSWLEWVCSDLAPRTRLWPGSLALFRRVWHWVMRNGGIEALHLSPASLRAGGATHFYFKNHNIQKLLFLRRWKSLYSCSCYIQESVALLVWGGASLELKEKIMEPLERFWVQISSPPRVHWQLLFCRQQRWQRLPRLRPT